MARFSLHMLQGGQRVVNLQSDFLDFLQTRLVAPLRPGRKTCNFGLIYLILDCDPSHFRAAGFGP